MTMLFFMVVMWTVSNQQEKIWLTFNLPPNKRSTSPQVSTGVKWKLVEFIVVWADAQRLLFIVQNCHYPKMNEIPQVPIRRTPFPMNKLQWAMIAIMFQTVYYIFPFRIFFKSKFKQMFHRFKQIFQSIAYRICRRKGRSIFGWEKIKKSGCGVYATTTKFSGQNITSICTYGTIWTVAWLDNGTGQF